MFTISGLENPECPRFPEIQQFVGRVINHAA
jgi:hypothetical protein